MIKFILENFDKIFKNKNSLEALDKFILEMAMKGKLVEQNQADEPASKFLEKIKKEKLVKEKNIKSNKAISTLVTEEEKPFKIPDTWQWVRLKDLGNIFNGNSVNEKEKKDNYRNVKEGYSYIGTKDIDYLTSKINYENGVKVPLDKAQKFKVAKENSVLICSEGGSAGKKIAIAEQKICFGNKLYAFESYYEKFDARYLFYIYKTNFFYNNFLENMTGMIGGVSINKFKNMIIPLAPENEIIRIVEKIQKLQDSIRKLKVLYDKNEKSIKELKKSILKEVEKNYESEDLKSKLNLIFNNFNKIIKEKEDVKELRKLILDLAIKGKLSNSNKNDTPASKLLERIKIEKKRLLEEKKIKKEKDLDSIMKEEIFFDVPKSWEVERLGNLLLSITKGSTPTTYGFDYQEKGINFIKIENVKDGKVLLETIKTFISEEANEYQKKSQLEEGDVLFSIAGTIGNTCIIKKDYLPANINQAFAILKGGNIVFDLEFFDILLNSLVLKEANFLARGGVMSNISLEDLKNMLVLIPPLEEQKRITQEVRKLMKFCDDLKEKFTLIEDKSEKLLKVIEKYS
ncbi:MAG: hypothetical protein CR959_01600 [Fusobacteriales bacterium]|nr:MAG: hypothetical protein CR959_01600 [Fusobacteriales bacterium]